MEELAQAARGTQDGALYGTGAQTLKPGIKQFDALKTEAVGEKKRAVAQLPGRVTNLGGSSGDGLWPITLKPLGGLKLFGVCQGNSVTSVAMKQRKGPSRDTVHRHRWQAGCGWDEVGGLALS